MFFNNIDNDIMEKKLFGPWILVASLKWLSGGRLV
jgi:hypothetical protein